MRKIREFPARSISIPNVKGIVIENLIIVWRVLFGYENGFITNQRTFYRMDDLKRHLENHKNPKFVIPSFTCDQCSKIFRNQTDLDDHKKIHVLKKFRVTCSFCGNGFKNEHARRVHKCPAKKKKQQNYKNGAKKGWEARKARLKSNENNEERDLEDEDDIEESNLIIDET